MSLVEATSPQDTAPRRAIGFVGNERDLTMNNQKESSDPKFVLVIAVLGGPGSGKTTLCSSLTGLEPDYNDHLPTEYKTKIKDGSLVVIFKELHLEEEFYDLNRGELKKSDGILGVFNTEDMHSLEFIAPTLQKIQNDGLLAKPLAMVAMNSQSPNREVQRKVGETTAKLLSLAYLEDSTTTLKSELFAVIQRVEPRDISEIKRKRKTKKKETSRHEKSKSINTVRDKDNVPKPKEETNSRTTSPSNSNHSSPTSSKAPSPANSRPSTVKITKQVVTFGKYEVVRIVGSGAEGRVYEAVDRETNQKVALKELTNGSDTESQEKIMRELIHPNIVRCFGTYADSTTSKKFLVMEFMKDGSLLERIKTHPDLSQEEIFAILKQIASALEFMEEKKVLHRDIALRNVLVKIESDGKWTVKMGDFGLARQPTRPDSDIYEMVTILRPLPLKQIPPECTHTRKWNPKCEAWSFGVLMWELLSRGQTPYQGIEEEVFEFLEKGKRLNRPDKCPDKLWRLMTQCWHHDPQQRPSFTDISLQLAENPYSWMPAIPRASQRISTSPYAEMPALPKIAKAPSLQQMMEALSATDVDVNLPHSIQKSTSLPNFINEVPEDNDFAVPRPTPYKPLQFAPPPAEPVVILPEEYTMPPPVCMPAAVYQPAPSALEPQLIFEPLPRVEPAFIPVEAVIEVAIQPPIQSSAPPAPVVSRPVTPVLTFPLPRPAEYSVYHDGEEHCAVESLTPEMTLEKARELLAEEVDFEIEKCNFFRTDTNQRVAFKQEKNFTVQKCTNGAFVIQLRTTS